MFGHGHFPALRRDLGHKIIHRRHGDSIHRARGGDSCKTACSARGCWSRRGRRAVRKARKVRQLLLLPDERKIPYRAAADLVEFTVPRLETFRMLAVDIA